MPDVKTHCNISLKRTNGKDDFKKLHEWMDEGTKYLKYDHRLERHFFTSEYKNFIEEEWGPKAVIEWLFHIAIDNLETANKFAVKEYQKSFEEIDIKFDGKMLSQCNFIKTTSQGNKKTFEISVNGKVKEEVDEEEKERYNKYTGREIDKPKKKFYNFKRKFR